MCLLEIVQRSTGVPLVIHGENLLPPFDLGSALESNFLEANDAAKFQLDVILIVPVFVFDRLI